ncbi:hypothetical protein APR50_28730 [Variovorax paradoxus]|nr:hypothetical protein APR52_04015 [Variovorax paradoxus]KPV01975.1 hypothetical protein APR50_28730 [Variovorax paradoxus]KPV02765.1 hypothetical protein APR49_28100 [Variovorax paradoxus]KPV17754.1 hypothetical protein APR51_25770 [Variovorax paradoxus]KPV27471.1 hypothetical protein APR48_28355 [Variovorax paradoxus]
MFGRVFSKPGRPLCFLDLIGQLPDLTAQCQGSEDGASEIMSCRGAGEFKSVLSVECGLDALKLI